MGKLDTELASGVSMGGINLGLFWTIALWALSTFGALTGAYAMMLQQWIKSELRSKLDKSDANDLIEEAIERYHERIVSELIHNVDAKHRENTVKFDKEATALGEVKEKLGEILGLLAGRRWKGPTHP